MVQRPSRFAYCDRRVPMRITINSIGNGIAVFLTSFGFSHSLLMTRTIIVTAEMVTAAKLTFEIRLMISVKV